ncbi:MAG: hypothetical protein ACOYJL_06865 [Tractidigestivibacter sp.]|jgi:hypothetical protein|uniref:hypothetical protein n=1 Tax=Tractidigestivibacter sp. TaxID=2847320 RepID=UPI003D8D2DF5
MATERDERRSVYVEKTRHELEELAQRGVRMGGNAFSSILLAKGDLTADELAGAEPFSGRDGVALRKSLERLGYGPEEWCWALLGQGGEAPGLSLDSELVRLTLTALDPATLVLCDEVAASAVRNAYADDLVELQDLEEAMLAPGYVVRIRGVRVLNLGGFEAALDDSRQKQVMWARLKEIPALGEPF